MAGTIRRSKDSVELVEEGGKSGEKYVLVPDGSRLRGVPILPHWVPLIDVSTPMVLHGFVRFGQTYWQEITLFPIYKQAHGFLEGKAEEWGKQALAEFDAEGLVDKTVKARS